MNTAYKKNFGKWGEEQLDKWMAKHNWLPVEKNLKIQKGEIDRIYCSQNNIGEKKFCITEIKTNIIYSKASFHILFTEVGIKKFIKMRQIKNLYKIGENYIARGYKDIYLRIFVIIKTNKKMNITKFNEKTCPFKLCYNNDNYYIFSIEPEFTFYQARKSLLQIKI
ncbi:hypothetical protein [Silvanigrella sp.]|jgi:Holliday junction resolvase-like predicted endonuclease|uniref:hypothetical protein n=1 Tax=Silvanigrella sp. TaxID=2024976 RepID=UPI0037C8FE23